MTKRRATGPPAGMTFQDYYEKTRNEPIHVILGVQGAGTNLLGRLLTRLLNFSVMRDRSAVFNAAARLGISPGSADVEREIREFKNMVWPSAVRRKTSRAVIRKNKPLEGLQAELRPSSIRSGADFARLVYTYRAYSLGASHIAIKSDDLWESIDRIDDVIPNRRVILLTRDFRDNLLSIAGKGFGPIEPICAATFVKEQLAYYTAEYRRAGPAGYHVKYETLITEIRRFLDDFTAHFGITPPPELQATVAALKFRPNKIAKWKALPPQQLAWCEGILQAELREFGYPIASPHPELPPSHEMLAASARDRLKRLPQKLRRVVARMRR